MLEFLVVVHFAALVVCNLRKPSSTSTSKFAKAYPYIRLVAGLVTDKVGK
ncbi:hypothetical protein [Hyphomicrobium sp.]|nr:hypothetical protein [Hyphomicrobium sp.]MBY0560025.1 hypothetical protein [Hyphomicrobium sp.]